MSDSKPKKLFLLDAYALIFRSYYAFIKNPRVTSKGLNTSAIFGFLLTLEEVLQKQCPSHIAVVFDTPTPTFRHEAYKGYKANRAETPEDIIKSVPYIKQIIEAFKIPVISSPGYEADDIIGTLSRLASEQGFETYMMTPDKDYAQLVKSNVFMFKPSRSGNDSILWGVEDIKREFSVDNPTQIIDLLALMGDSADNIPGAPGIGPKTAKKLLAEYSSVEGVIENVNKLTGKVKEAIENNIEQIKLSKFLATINQYVPVELDEVSLFLCDPDYQELLSVYEELEFKTFANKINLKIGGMAVRDEVKPIPAPALKERDNHPSLFDNPYTSDLFSASTHETIKTVEHNYKLISEKSEIEHLINIALTQKAICFDTETTCLSAIDAELIAISLSWEKGTGYLIHFPESREKILEILAIIQPLFKSTVLKIGQNIKFDIQVLANYGFMVCEPLFDTMLAHYLLEPDMRHNMNYLAEIFLNYSPVEIESLIGEKRQGQRSMRSVSLDQLTEYAVEDADITYQLRLALEPLLQKEKLENLFNDIEMPLVPVLAAMERNGIILDTSSLQTVADDLRKDILALEQDIYSLAGTQFNISSPKQLGDILFVRMKLDDKAKMTKSKQYVTDEETLQHLKHKNPIIEKVLDYRGLRKLLSTYVDALPALINPHTGRIHTSFNQAVTATGRLSSTNPNLQNIPVREERGRLIRKAFVPASGCKLLSADYSQIELRLMAHLSQDANMIDDFNSGHDIHSATAAKIFNVPISEVTREMRGRAKTANFGIIYGISAFGLAERLGISRQEAKELIDGYFRTYPQVKAYMEESIQVARVNGYVQTIFGRKRYLRDISSRNQVIRGNAERNAINAPIQGSAADLIKIAMIRIHENLQKDGFKSKMILQVHDELLFEVPEEEISQLRKMVVYEMENAVKLSIPLLVESGIGNNWLEAH